MIILGLHIGHDASAAILINGKLEIAIQEERFTRIKNYSGFPEESINYILKELSLDKNQIDIITIGGNKIGIEIPLDLLKIRLLSKNHFYFLLKYRIKILFVAIFRLNFIRKFIYNEKNANKLIISAIKQKGFKKAEFHFIDHHLCHAASAFYSSPFKDSLVITQDGKGDESSGSLYVGENNHLKKIYTQKSNDSIGQIYAEVTRFLGFKPNRHEGKITGLAAYGTGERYLKFFKNLVNNTYPTIKRSNLKNKIIQSYKSINLSHVIGALSNHPSNLNYELNALRLQTWMNKNLNKNNREDIAFAVQKSVEDWTVEMCKNYISESKMNLKNKEYNICLAGGLFANVKINQKIKEISGVKNIYIHPAMGDCGLSLGSAQYYYYSKNKQEPHSYINHSYLGPSYSKDEILKLLEKTKNIEWQYIDNIEKKIAILLAKGAVIGRFSGRTEWGPRALGNRSILIQATDSNINNIMNKRLNRSEFMPFAPSVLDFRAKDYFINYKDDDCAADFMTITYDVFPEKVNEIQAVVHIDNTARPQVVKKTANNSFYKILENYNEISGIGCLVNTSFNLHEEPIVNSPKDAVLGLKSGALDYLAIENYIVKNV